MLPMLSGISQSSCEDPLQRSSGFKGSTRVNLGEQCSSLEGAASSQGWYLTAGLILLFIDSVSIPYMQRASGLMKLLETERTYRSKGSICGLASPVSSWISSPWVPYLALLYFCFSPWRMHVCV